MLTGSLDTFTSSEVLRLVAGTRKTGSLVVHGLGPLGAPIEVDVRVRDGAVVAAHGGTPIATDTRTALADMLRISQGEFSFDADVTGGVDGDAIDVEQAIAAAESVVAEWKSVESVVPSLEVAVELTASIEGPVTLQPEQWTTVSAVGSGCSVRDLSRITGQGPLAACRSVKEIVDLGIARVLVADDAPSAEPDGDEPDATPYVDGSKGSPELVVVDPFESVPEDVEPVETATIAGDVTAAGLPLGSDSADLVSAPEAEVPVVSERFRHFSPRAAVAMALSETGTGPHSAPGDESVNRNVLLKFLASARRSA